MTILESLNVVILLPDLCLFSCCFVLFLLLNIYVSCHRSNIFILLYYWYILCYVYRLITNSIYHVV